MTRRDKLQEQAKWEAQNLGSETFSSGPTPSSAWLFLKVTLSYFAVYINTVAMLIAALNCLD